MISFKEFVLLDEAFEVEKTKMGSHIYTHPIGEEGHKIRTSFFNRSTDKTVPGRYEISVARVDPEGNVSDNLAGRTNLSPETRFNMIRAVGSHVNHFIKNNKPYELYGGGNTRAKRELYPLLMKPLSKRYGAETTHSSTISAMRFPPTPEQKEKVDAIKKSNLEKIKAAAKKRTGNVS